MPLNPNLIGRSDGFDRLMRGIQMGKQNRLSDLQANQIEAANQKQSRLAEIAKNYYNQQPQNVPFEAETFPGESPIPGLQQTAQPDKSLAGLQERLMQEGFINEGMTIGQASQKGLTPLQKNIAQIYPVGSPEYKEAMEKAVLKPDTQINMNSGNLTPGFKKVDEKFATEYIDWKASGGFADVEKQLSQLESATNELRAGTVETGPMAGLTPDAVKTVTAPKLLSLKQNVEEVVQRNLRAILGPQFTEKEGERLIARAFDDRLPPQENMKRINRLITQIRAAAQAKQEAVDYFDTKGTLQGFKGKTYSRADFSPGKLFSSKKNNAPKTWKEGGYEYRELPNGKVERRKINGG